jgi:hypothetical protein
MYSEYKLDRKRPKSANFQNLKVFKNGSCSLFSVPSTNLEIIILQKYIKTG